MTFLLAQHNRGDSLSESFRAHAGVGRDDALLGLLMVAALLAGLWAVSRLLGLRRRRRAFHNPWQLFWELCKAHRLNWSDRSLLGRLARHCQLADPARLFLEVQHWDEQPLGPAFALDFVRLRALRKQIFEGTAEDTNAEPAPRPVARGGGFNRASDARAKVVPQPGPSGIANAGGSSLMASPPAPTLDVPPWTETPAVGS
jgi:hypothetical protein